MKTALQFSRQFLYYCLELGIIEFGTVSAYGKAALSLYVGGTIRIVVQYIDCIDSIHASIGTVE